jgi:ribosome-binding ATPase YchF (GTP1/OBG family)
VCGKIEAELVELAPEEQCDYLASYGLKESALERLISATHALLTATRACGRRACYAWKARSTS